MALPWICLPGLEVIEDFVDGFIAYNAMLQRAHSIVLSKGYRSIGAYRHIHRPTDPDRLEILHGHLRPYLLQLRWLIDPGACRYR